MGDDERMKNCTLRNCRAGNIELDEHYVEIVTDGLRRMPQSPPTPKILVRDAVRQKLELVVQSRRIACVTLPDKILHKIGCLTLALLQHKSLLEVLHALWLEAWQAAVHHQQHNL